VEQTINVAAGRYQLLFDLGQSGGPNAPPASIGPVSLNVTIGGVINPPITVSFTTDPNKALWQTQTIPLIQAFNDGDITLTFLAPPDQTKPFIGLDNVSLKQLKPVGACLRP